MRRTEMIELHDHPRFPKGLRDLVTDALEALWEFGNSYRPILGLLREALPTNGDMPVDVLDLCSGGGGPWLRLARQLEEEYGCPVRICLSDKYPNRQAFERLKTRSQNGDSKLKLAEDVRASPNRSAINGPAEAALPIGFTLKSVDALDVPAEMHGFRTMFSAFHHFGPVQARRVLASAMANGQGVGIFEVARRGPWTMVVLCFTPLLVLLLTPRMRPFRWSRLLWTYLIPVVPFVIWFDGWASCLRTYSKAELEEMVREISEQPFAAPFRWQTGEARTGLLPVTYLIGYPTAPEVCRATSERTYDPMQATLQRTCEECA